MDNGQAAGSMSVDELDAYIARLFERQSELGEHYVRRQVEWAEGRLQALLAHEHAAMAGACAPGGAGLAA